MRVRGARGLGVLTLRSVTERMFSDVLIKAESPACDVRVSPSVLPAFGPAQMTDVAVDLRRRDGVASGEHPVVFTVLSAGKLVGTFDLKVDTSQGITPEDRGMIKLGRANLRPAPSRWHYAVYLAVPLAVVIIWYVLRRRSRRVK
jgi:hypothetical protein